MEMQNNGLTAKQSIPTRLVIDVTGHRNLVSTQPLTEHIRKLIETARQMVRRCETLHYPSLFYPYLAEGADRLVIKEVLNIPGSVLERLW
ncbi:MAG: hypothetical protein PHO26_07720 [Dehalococcoidia bacterium]|nr:hypothetical protein [Dehalococcoidia bacterium]